MAVARLVVARTYFDLPDALVAKSVLDAHGFVAILCDWQTVSMAWHWTVACDGVKLCTLDVSLPDALRLLDEGQEEETQDLVTTVRAIDIFMAWFALFYAGLPWPVRRRKYRKA